MKTILKLSVIFLMLGSVAQAQVGINTLDPDTSAILHIYSNTKGVLLPTVDSNARAGLAVIPAAAEGLLVYDSVDKVYHFFNRKTGKWLALNPFQTTDEVGDPGSGTDDIRLADRFQNRNVVIGGGNADSDAKLHVKGNVRSSGTVYAENANITNTISTKDVRVSDSTWSKKIGSDTTTTNMAHITTAKVTNVVDANTILADSIHTATVRAISSYGRVPVGAIVMWTGTAPPDTCWKIITEMGGRFPVGAGTVGDGITYTAGNNYDNSSRQGQNMVTLNSTQVPNHSHGIIVETYGSYDVSNAGSTRTAVSGLGGTVWQSGTNRPGISTNSTTGGGGSHENRPPFFGVHFIKKTSNNCPD
jgi:hypothetical protein